MNEGNKHRQVGHNKISDTAEGLESGIDSFTAIKQYLPYDDYVKEWLVAATTLRNEQEYFELHREEILNYCNGSANEKKKRFNLFLHLSYFFSCPSISFLLHLVFVEFPSVF